MADNRERRLMGLQPESQIDDDDDDDDDHQRDSESLQEPQQATRYSGPPGQQPAMSPAGCSSDDSGEDSDSSDQGGALMAQIKMLESPVCSQDFVFGDELPDETPGGKKSKKKKKPKRQEVVSYIYTPLPIPPESAAGSVHCASPVNQPSPCSVVDSVQRCGEIIDNNRALSSMPVCSNGDGAGKATAKGPYSVCSPAVGKGADSGAGVHSPVGEGGGSVPEVGAVAPDIVMDSPKKNVHENVKDILFCIGAADPIDQQLCDSADEVEGTNKSRAGVTSKPSRSVAPACKRPTKVSPALVLWEAEENAITRSIQRTPSSGNVSAVAGPVSVNESVHGGVGGMTAGVIGGDVTGDNVTGGGGNVISSNVNACGGDVTENNVVDSVSNVSSNVGNVLNSGVGGGSGPVAPPVVTSPARSYADATAGGGRMPSSSPDSGDGVLQQRLLEALKKGERSINVEGREVDLSFWIERHGFSAFREERGRETVWSLPTAGQGVIRRNVVRLRWRGSDTCPTRAKVVELLLKMGFKATDIFALIHPYGTSEFDVSFVRAEGLELFWSNYELTKNEPGWRDFAVQAVSRQNEIKRVTVLTRNESLSCVDIMTWIGRYGEVMGVPQKNRDEFGIWSGAWTFLVKLKRSGNTVTHIPSSAFLGRDRIQIFYQGQPKLCHRCGSPTHISADCKAQKCALCGALGHLAASCGEIRCHLCGDLGHPFSRCPRSFANAVLAPAGESHVVESAGEGTSRGGGAEVPVRKSKKKTPAQLRRLEMRQKEREMKESRITGMTSDPSLKANLAAEALRDDELNEEVRRIQNEEGAISSDSQWESVGEDDGRWLGGKRKRGTKKKGVIRSSSSRVQMPKEGKTYSPLVSLSNRFQALNDNSSPSLEGEAEGEVQQVAVGPLEGAESCLSGEHVSSRGRTGLESGDEDGKSGNMDTSVSLKRVNSFSDVEGGEGSGKKKAI